MVPPTDEPKAWQDSKHICKRTKYLLENPEAIPTDVTFQLRGHTGFDEEIPAHTFILAIGSVELYRALMKPTGSAQNGGNSNGFSSEHGKVFPVDDVSPEVFRIFLRYLYSEEVAGLTMENVMETIYCAKKYRVQRLLTHCRDFVQDNLSADTCCAILSKSYLYEEEKTGILASCIISSQMAKVVATPGFLSLPEQILLVILARNDLSIGENDVYQAARLWVMHNYPLSGEFEEAFSRLIDCIHLPIMTPSQIANGPAKDRVLTGNELSEVYNFIFADQKPVIRFSSNLRAPRPRAQYVTMKMTEEDTEKAVMAEDTITIEVRCDVAPLASGIFLDMCNNERIFKLTYGDADFVRRLPLKLSQGKTNKRKSGPAEQNGNGVLLGDKTFPIENQLFANIPGMVSFIVEAAEDGKEEARIETLQISHPEKKANQYALNGMVFAKVVRGLEALKVFSLGVEDWRKPRRTHCFSNVVVHAELNDEEIEEEL